MSHAGSGCDGVLPVACVSRALRISSAYAETGFRHHYFAPLRACPLRTNNNRQDIIAHGFACFAGIICCTTRSGAGGRWTAMLWYRWCFASTVVDLVLKLNREAVRGTHDRNYSRQAFTLLRAENTLDPCRYGTEM